MYNILKNVIDRGEYNLSSVISKVDKLWAEDKITDAKREELLEMARVGAKPENSVNLFKMFEALELRVKALEEGTDTPNTDSPPEYNEYTVYHKGDKITYNSRVYICIAPEGQPCTWSPDGYPPYWELE